MKVKNKIAFSIVSFLLVAVICGTLFLQGIIKINTPSIAQYPVRGVDVSEYQGQINWQTIEQQGMQFAFVKATEGSGYIDPFFTLNWEAVYQTSIIAGAYHFFSFDSPAQTQAENFISTVELRSGMLPPVVDIELYGPHKNNHPNAETVRAELNLMLNLLEEYYGVKPIIYTTQQTYALYIRGYYDEYPIWIRDVYFIPSSNIEWTFWQYTDKGRLEGYNGEEQYIDINVFAGDIDKLRTLTAN